MTNPIDDLIISISEKMEQYMEEESVRNRVVEPSAGDTFDVYYSSSYGERFYYINTDYVLPLHALRNGEISEFRAYKSNGHDTTTWEDILDSIDDSDYPADVAISIVGNKNAHIDKSESSVIDWLSQWAAKHPSSKESVLIRLLIGAVRG